jgi:XTP/dITP diphosphohydrolase
MKTLLLATQNKWKAQLFGPILQEYGFNVITIKDTNITKESPVEDGETVVENALIKARHYHSDEHPWVFGDDTGLEIKALNGEPGVQSRRWGGKFPNNVDEQVWLNYLLERMQGIPPEERVAEFVDGWALITPDGSTFTHVSRAAFTIAKEPLAPIVPGSPVMSVAIGLPEKPEEIFAAVKEQWDAWGILGKLE